MPEEVNKTKAKKNNSVNKEKNDNKKNSSTKKSATKSNSSSTTKKKTGDSKSVSKNDEKKNIKKQSKQDDNRVKQLIAEQLDQIEKMDKKIQNKNEKKEKEKVEEKKELKAENNPKKKETKNKETKKQETKSKGNKNKEKKFDPEEIAKKIEDKKKLPKEEKLKLYKKMFWNIIMGAIITIYLIFINLGYINIEPERFVTDLKVFSIAMIFITIVIFEKAYKNDSDEIAICGIETLLLAIITLISIYIFLIYKTKYMIFISGFSCLIDFYYIVKILVIYKIGKKRYKNSISDVKEIIEEE